MPSASGTTKKNEALSSASVNNNGNNNNCIVADEDWANGLPDRIYDLVFSHLSGKDLLSCRLVCTVWETLITPLLSTKCCLVYKGRPKYFIGWLINKVTRFSSPSKRFNKVCLQNPSMAKGWDEIRLRDLTATSSKMITSTLLSPALNPSVNFNNVKTLHISNSVYRFQRLQAFFALMPQLEKFSDISTYYLLDCKVCCKTFPEVQAAILKPYEEMRCPIKHLKVKREDAGFKTVFLMKMLQLVCGELEIFDLEINTFMFPFPLAIIDRMDYASLVGFLLNLNSATLKELRLQWVGHLSYHFYDDCLRCLNVMSLNNTPWNLTKVYFHFDWIFLGNPEFQTIFVPFIQRLEHLEELKMKNVVLQAEWAAILDQVKPDNYATSNPIVEFGTILTDNIGVSIGQTNVNVIAEFPYLMKSVKTIRAVVSSEQTDELRKILPIDTPGAEFSAATELHIQNTEWKPQMRFITYNMDKLCPSFKNLTTFVIADGDKLQYRKGLRSSKQWKKMSNAHICDDDMQNILRNLTLLKTLRIRGRMVYLTDCGTVGLSPGIVNEMRSKPDLMNIPYATGESTGLSISNLTGNGFKECLNDGTWFRHPDSNLVWSNYTTCINLDDFQWKLFINRLYEAGYLISVLALVLSLIIFCTFKCLECTRVKIHRNLFASFIIDNLLWVAWYRFIIADEYVVLTNPWWCKWLFALVQYFLIANYFWMFCEGFYLHTLLVFAFLRSESQLLKGFYVLGWLGPSIPISFYIYFRLKDGYQEDQACWIEPRHQMFVTMPVCISLVLNLIFLINILRVLVTKLNDQRGFRNPSGTSSSVSTSPENQYSLKKAARATLILIPLLGVHYLLLPFRPNPGTTYEAIYDVVSAITSSLQGFCVAILFCFCNTEVISVFRRRVCPKFCVRNHSSPTHANRGDSAMPTNRSNSVPILNGSRREAVRGRVQSRTSVEMFEEAI
ncbi:Calcitonin-like peptide type 1 receptor [Orchesella cincta]|uniref:Calcitonin-like peptide type 1 receptor n=1 Tax=Orchesella cincta TaxID=48709 RepID=A0A1D2MMC9_ORCCI|nr:Calcitonin-like peptide type 1 receptor [Orchesella cincta]